MSEAKKYTDEWKMLKSLSSGGQATTQQVQRLSEPGDIAVAKLLNRQNDPDRRARMHRESTSLETLSSPNIARFVDSNTAQFKNLEYKLFIITEYIPGHTIEEYDFSKHTLEEKIALIQSILETIDYCHKEGIIHRDIKPDNIILRNNEITTPVIIDFGLSFNTNDEDDDHRTPDGEQLGNRFLILPEQKSGEASKRDSRSDITCIVGLLFYFLTGIKPIVLYDQENNKPHQRTVARQILDAIPKHQRDIIYRIFDNGFEQMIDKRWQTAPAVLDQLKLLKESRETIVNNAAEYINLIKKKVENKDYSGIKSLDEFLQGVQENTSSAISEIATLLGTGWGSIQTGLTDDKKIFKKRFAPFNKSIGYEGKTIIHAYPTGSEFVIILSEGDKNNEMIRQPIEGFPIDWNDYRERLKNHYLEMIFENI